MTTHPPEGESKTTITLVELLTDARDRISDPMRHTRNVLAADSGGFPTNPGNPRATCWCSIGSVQRSRYELGPVDQQTMHEAAKTLDFAAMHLTGRTIVGANDFLRHEALMDVWAEAITIAHKKEGSRAVS